MDNILIIVDLEAIIGIEDLCDEETNEKLLYKEISTIVDSIPSSINIYLCYSHNDGILPDSVKELNRDINIVEKIKNIDFNIKYNMAFLIGFHGKKSDKCRFPHTFRSEIDELLLGGKEVGEIEMIVNLLSYHNIPVSLISTECEVINYLNYNCIYHDINGEDDILIYERLKNDVINAVNSKPDVLRFDGSEVKIFFNQHVLNMIKELMLCIKTSFKDTIDFFNYLPNLHIPLNYIIKRDMEIMYQNIFKYKPESLAVIKDEHIKKLLNKNIDELSHMDLYEILKCFLSLCEGDKDE
ncbi:M55 family metallopeptidase [uncultured Tissierella sp.]|uniref:M55 family metallopeptidase n=1 Tax=uncultured Tissierella sp. TaxID=448160 RepID=UPI002803FC7B|nr:M55 family metallopeptidase [uncultured Tissierella sp.]MDU5082780.1 M55 family metallopeptidase [Bacillota bacterium]